MEFKKINISDLKHADYNPRKDLKPGDSEFEKIRNSITEIASPNLAIVIPSY